MRIDINPINNTVLKKGLFRKNLTKELFSTLLRNEPFNEIYLSISSKIVVEFVIPNHSFNKFPDLSNRKVVGYPEILYLF